MNPSLRLLLQIALNSVALMLLPELIDGLQVDSWTAAVIAAVLIGIANALIRPILILITLPITLLSLGLFTLVINALLFWLVTGIVGGLHVPGFGTAFWAALLYSLLTWLVGLTLGDNRQRAQIMIGRRH